MPKKTYPYENLSLKNIPGERWQDIEGHEDEYRVSSFGRVKSLPKYREVYIPSQRHTIAYWTPLRILTQKVHIRQNSFGKRPYYECTVSLHKEKIPKRYMVHRLVYHAFVQPLTGDPMKTLILHKDGNGRLNHYKNLVAGSRTDSLKKAYAKGRHKSPFAIKTPKQRREIYAKSAKGKHKAVIQYDLKGNALARFESIKSASAATGITAPNIIGVLKGRAKAAKGSVWQYASNSRK